MEIAIAVAAKIAESIVVPVLRPVLHPAIHHAQFMFRPGKIKRNLDTVKAELKSKEESVKEKKREARKRNEIAADAVEEWSNEVSRVMEEVGHLEEQVQEGSSCCWSWCSTLKGYRLCKQLAKITESMKCLNQNGEFDPFSHPASISDMGCFTFENFQYFESTKLAFDKLLEALGEDGVYMIGLYGMGGSGKTTLVNEIGTKAKELKLFDHVVTITVSQTVNVGKIQTETADFLRFKFDAESETVRARELLFRLQNGEKILIILDELTSLRLKSCSEIECIIDTATFDHSESFRVGAKFPKLVELALQSMDNLKEIISGPPSLVCFFEKLQDLFIDNCNKLTSLFPLSIAQSLMQLKNLTARNYSALKYIMINEENNGTDAIKKEIFPNLKCISFNTCDELECVFPISVASTLFSLEQIDICGCKQLKSIIRNEGEDAMTHNEEPLNPSNTQPSFPKLRRLMVIGCDKLKYLFCVSIAKQLPQLEELFIWKAAQLEQAFRYKMADVSCNIEKIQLPNLRMLRLQMLPNFVFICIGLKVDVVKLRSIQVEECPKFDSVYVQYSIEGYRLNGGNTSDICDDLNVATIKDLLQRESSVGLRGLAGRTIFRTNFDEATLLLFGCSKIESIIDTTTSNHSKSFQLGAESPKLVKLEVEGVVNLKEVIRGRPSLPCAFEKLEYLPIEDCPNLTSLFPSSVAQSLLQLKYLTVRNCYELKHIIIVKEENGTEEDQMEILPSLENITINNNASGLRFNKSSMSFIWMGPPQSLKVKYLQNVDIVGCGMLKSIFSTAILHSFPELTQLSIRDCEALEEIMTNHEDSHNQFSGQPCFPKLRVDSVQM